MTARPSIYCSRESPFYFTENRGLIPIDHLWKTNYPDDNDLIRRVSLALEGRADALPFTFPFHGERQTKLERTGYHRSRPNNNTRHVPRLRGAWRLGAGAGIFLSLLSRHRDCAFVLAMGTWSYLLNGTLEIVTAGRVAGPLSFLMTFRKMKATLLTQTSKLVAQLHI